MGWDHKSAEKVIKIEVFPFGNDFLRKNNFLTQLGIVGTKIGALQRECIL